MTGAPASRRTRPVGPVVHLALAALLLALVVPNALRTSGAPAPQIAEFAPQAKQIKDPPKEQAANVGKDSEGRTGAGSGSPSASPGPNDPSAKPGGQAGGDKEVPRQLTCYGNPPRQTEDPQSPPCVPAFSGDNGGATSRGVTADAVKVGVPKTVYDATTDMSTMVRYFNARYQFYGRRLEVVPIPDSGNGNISVADMVADAAAAEQAGVFAVLGYPEKEGAEYVFYNELARRKILSVQWYSLSAASQRDLAAYAPYQWGFLPAVDDIMRNYSELVCKQLKDQPPVGGPYAPTVDTSRRRWGILRQTFANGEPAVDLQPLESGLKACGVSYVKKDLRVSSNAATAASVMTELRDAGVTSVLTFFTAPGMGTIVHPAASSQAFYPEWWISNYVLNDNDGNAFVWPDRRQSGNTMGLMSNNRFNAAKDSPAYWAGREVDSSYALSYSYSYPMLLTLASGIQMAGPRLTPQAFEDGLFQARFPNPGAGAAPYYQATVGFGPLDHTMYEDFAPVWYSPTDTSYWTGRQGAYCYVDRGRRYGLGEWPTRAQRPLRFRTGSCR